MRVHGPCTFAAATILAVALTGCASTASVAPTSSTRSTTASRTTATPAVDYTALHCADWARLSSAQRTAATLALASRYTVAGHVDALQREIAQRCQGRPTLTLRAVSVALHDAATPKPRASTTTAPPPPPPAPSTPAVRSTSTPPPPPPAAPSTSAAPSCYPLTNGGNCYEPGEYCRNSDHGVSGVAGDGERIVCADNNGWRWEPV